MCFTCLWNQLRVSVRQPHFTLRYRSLTQLFLRLSHYLPLLIHHFYRATLCQCGICRRRVSVCVCVCAGDRLLATGAGLVIPGSS